MRARRTIRSGRPNFTPPVGLSSAPKEQKVKRVHRRLRLILWAAAALALLILIFVWGRPTGIEVRGDNASATDITAVVRAQLHGVLGGNLFMIDSAKVAGSILQAHPERFASVVIKRNLLARRLIVVVSERKSVLYWQTGQEEYGVDKEGIVVSRAVGPPDLPLISDKTNLEAAVGKSVASTSFIDFASQVIADLKAKTGLRFKSAYIEETTTELFVNTDRGFFIRFDTSGKPGEQLAMVKSILNRQPIINRYIDVRIPYKAYYR